MPEPNPRRSMIPIPEGLTYLPLRSIYEMGYLLLASLSKRQTTKVREDPIERRMENNQQHESSPQTEFVRRGDLNKFLRRNFLHWALKKHPELKDIPEFVGRLLGPMFIHKYVNRTITYGSVPRAIAEGRVPYDYWLVPEFFENEAQRETDPKVKPTLDKLTVGPRDLDFKVDIQDHLLRGVDPQKYVSHFAKLLISKHNFDPSLFYEHEFKAPSGETIKRTKQRGKIEFRGYAVNISYGTNPDLTQRENIEIQVFKPGDLENDQAQPIFLIHLGLIPKTADQALIDKRVGTTSITQDKVIGIVSGHGKTLYYALTREAVEIMQEKSKFHEPEILEKKSVFDLLESAVRDLRISLWKIKQFDSNLGINSFFPLTDTTSLRQFRLALLEQFIQGDGRQVHTDILNAKVLLRELFLCFTISPHLTAMFIRDSLLTMFFPDGFANRQFWNNVLASPSVASALSVSFSPILTTDPEFLTKQIAAYGESGKFDGMKRIIEAMRANGAPFSDPAYSQISPWSEFHEWVHNATPFFMTQNQSEEENQIKINEALKRLQTKEDMDRSVAYAVLQVLFCTGDIGITAKEIAQLVGLKMHINSPVDISKEFLALKLAGLVDRESADYDDGKDNNRRIDLYRLSLDDLKSKTIKPYGSNRFFRRILEDLYNRRTDERIQAGKIIQGFDRVNISNVVILKSLTEDDYLAMGGIRQTALPGKCYGLASSILEAIKKTDEHQI